MPGSGTRRSWIRGRTPSRSTTARRSWRSRWGRRPRRIKRTQRCASARPRSPRISINQPAPPRLHDRLATLWASSTHAGAPAGRVAPGAPRRGVRAAAGRRGVDARGARAVDGARRSAALDRQPRVCDGVHGVRAAARRRAGVACRAWARRLRWLRSHQDPVTGAWPAVSMNKKYPDGLDAVALHAGRRHGLCRNGARGGRRSPLA